MLNTVRFPLTIFAALAVVLIAELLYFYPQLPDTVASHFDADGVPDGWMSKTAYAAITLVVMVLSAAPTVVVALMLPNMEGSINIPNKAYWLAPERREETLGLIASALVWIECFVIALLIVLTYAVCAMNIEGKKTLDWPMFPTLALFFCLVASIVGRMILRFRRGNDSGTSYP